MRSRRSNAFRCAIYVAKPRTRAYCRHHWLSNCEIMTLRELINSVDFEQYTDSPLYQKLRETKPEYGANRRIQVKLVNGEVTVTNVHVGSLGDILTYQIDVAPDLQVTKMQLLDEILKEMSSNTFSDEEQAEFWDDFDNLQKAKIIR